MENLTSIKLTWANENHRRANLPRRPFQTHISTISVHDAEFSAKKRGPVASRPAKRRYHERHFTIGNAPAKNFARRTMRTEGRKACEESVFRWQGQLECKAALEDARPVLQAAWSQMGQEKSRPELLPTCLSSHGGDEGIRTLGPHVANVMLSQLSYIPTGFALLARR